MECAHNRLLENGVAIRPAEYISARRLLALTSGMLRNKTRGHHHWDCLDAGDLMKGDSLSIK